MMTTNMTTNTTDLFALYAGTPYAIPAGTDLTATKQPLILAVNIAGVTLSIIFIGLRFWARILSQAQLGMDEYFMLPALFFGIIFACFNIFWMVPKGTGKHIWVTGDLVQAVEDFNFGLFVLELCYTSVIVFVKFSILAFYRRIFRVDSIKLPLYILWCFVGAWGIALWTTTVFQCMPISGFWDKTIEAQCNVDVASFFLGNSIPNILTDVALMILPLPYIYKLHLRAAQKAALAGVFALGTFVAVISATRLVFIMSLNLHDVNITWNFIDTEVWSTLELDIAMICACLPSIRPVLALVFQKAMGSNSRSGLFGKAKGNSSKLSDGVWAGGFSKHHDQGDDSKRTHGKNSNKDIFGDEEHDDRTHFTKTTIVAGSHRTLSSDDVELAQMHAGKAVLVSTDVKMEWENRV